MSDLSSLPVTVEIERSFNPVSKTWQQAVSIKLDATALAHGVLAAISDRDWKTLCITAVEHAMQGPPPSGPHRNPSMRNGQ